MPAGGCVAVVVRCRPLLRQGVCSGAVPGPEALNGPLAQDPPGTVRADICVPPGGTTMPFGGRRWGIVRRRPLAAHRPVGAGAPGPGLWVGVGVQFGPLWGPFLRPAPARDGGHRALRT